MHLRSSANIALLACVICSADVLQANAQTVSAALAPVPAGAYAATQQPAAGPAAASAGPVQEGAQPAANDRQQKRLEKIRQLQFDRRPSTILKVWLQPPAGPPQEVAPNASPSIPATPDEPPKEAPVEGAGSEKSDAERTDADKAADEKAAADAKAAAEKALADKAAQEEQARADAEFDRQLKDFQRNVTLGEWTPVKTYLTSLEKAESRELYARLLESLRSGPMGAQQNVDPNMLQRLILDGANPAIMQAVLSGLGQGPGAGFIERNVFSMADVQELILAVPHELDDDAFSRLGTILGQALAAGHDLEVLLRGLTPSEDDAEPAKVSRREIARLLFGAGQEVRAGPYLPSLEEASSQQDSLALNLIARHWLAMNAKEQKADQLERAWQATQAVLAIAVPPPPPEPVAPPTATPPVPVAQAVEKTPEQLEQETQRKRAAELRAAKDEGLQRAVELAPRVRDELGQQWLDDSFTTQIERGREILVTIGTLVSTNMASRPTDADFRLKSLQLERTAVEALLRAAPETAAQWQDPLTVLAIGWLREAQVSSELDQRSGMGPGWRRDRYGNFFFTDEETQVSALRYNQGNAQPIKTEDLLEVRPSDAWLALVRADLQPKFAGLFAELFLKANEETKAFPFIAKLAGTHPDRARELAEQFIRVWTSNHNPNEARANDPFMYYYGYEQRAERIPLTRSKQERNLKELAEWVRRLRELPLGELDERLLTQAFTTAHSRAEVYRLEAIENVFGSMDNLKPRTLAELIQQMRGNLAGVWRAPDVQKQNSTNRKQRDIQLEVLHGYEVARAVVQKGLAKHPEHWALTLAEACLLHDENDFKQEVQKDSGFSDRRAVALDRFRQAAEQYGRQVNDLPEEEQASQVYEQWFYASLGAVDLARITADKIPDLKQAPLIRQSLTGLSGETGERHMAQFANNLFTRANSAKPELKFRYLRTGFEIVGDHKMAREARKLLDYYGDLVTEIKLEAKIDGSDVVGHGQAFGVFVNIVHTKEIERESGGFGRYLQNQNNNQNYFYYNFGRPLENYRDKFTDVVKQALGEHFDVVSVTFQNAEVNSRALPEYGWRVTPYAYLLLKARGAEVDKLAPLRLDLDFLDTSGYAILPVESPATPVDARPDDAPARPAADIRLTQTLDERQAAEGKLVLEIRAFAHGLVPDLDELVDLKPAGFEIVQTDDGGVSVTEFDKEAAGATINSERIWTVSLRASENAEGRPKVFDFGAARLPVKEMIYQRYDDADLVAVQAQVSLDQHYGRESFRWLWVGVAAAVTALVAVLVVARRWRRRQGDQVAARFQLPDPLTPFTVIGLLRDIQVNNGLTEPARRDLTDSIGRLERHYFQTAEPTEPNLREIAERWLTETAGGVGLPHAANPDKNGKRRSGIPAGV